MMTTKTRPRTSDESERRTMHVARRRLQAAAIEKRRAVVSALRQLVLKHGYYDFAHLMEDVKGQQI